MDVVITEQTENTLLVITRGVLCILMFICVNMLIGTLYNRYADCFFIRNYSLHKEKKL